VSGSGPRFDIGGFIVEPAGRILHRVRRVHATNREWGRLRLDAPVGIGVPAKRTGF